MDILRPKDHAEAVAAFRHGIVGRLFARDLGHGELAAALRVLSEERFRAPGADSSRTYSIPTLQRWYYLGRHGGFEALRPRGRSDQGRGRDLTPDLRTLLLDIRREYPDASTPLIIRTLEGDGRLQPKQLKPGTLRRLYKQEGLDRIPTRDGKGPKTRLRWEAALPDALWHGDVCHGPTLTLGGVRTPVRIHGLLDDCSRYVVALEAHPTEREEDMLHVLVRALLRSGKPDALYLDNGSTYRGEALRLACARLGISLLHARPYDPQARGKMERFWRTLREGCLDHLGQVGSLDDVNKRLDAFLIRHYHQSPHAGLLGRSPLSVYGASERAVVRIEPKQLRDAMTVRDRRRVRRDSTVSIAGKLFELDEGYLAGRIVTVAYSALDEPIAPWVEADERRFDLHPVDPKANARRKRPPRRPGHQPPKSPPDFDPSKALTAPATRDEEALDEIF
jgi:transposase InsO family protein